MSRVLILRYNRRMDEIDRIVEQWEQSRPDLDVSPTHTLQRITRLSLLQGVSFARVFAPYGVSFGEYLVLAALRRAGPPYRMNPTTLFNSVILSSGAMTNRLDRLEAMGLVAREADPDRPARSPGGPDRSRPRARRHRRRGPPRERATAPRRPRCGGARAAGRAAPQAAPVAAVPRAGPGRGRCATAGSSGVTEVHELPDRVLRHGLIDDLGAHVVLDADLA